MGVEGYYGSNVNTTTYTPSGGGWTPGAGRDESGYLPTSPHYGGDGSGNGNGDGNGGGLDLNWFDDQDEQLQADIDALEATTHPYGGLMLAEELANITGQRKFNIDPSTGKEIVPWDFNPDNPYNRLGDETRYNLSKFISTDWEGNPILDSSGNVIWSGFGKYAKENYGDIRPAISGTSDFENLQGLEKQYYSQQEEQEQRNRMMGHGQGYNPGGGGSAGGYGTAYGVKGFYRARPENISPWARNIAGTPMLPVAGSGAGGSMAAADELYALASGKKAFSMTPEEQGILTLLNA